jgi:aminoglycoside phosphotransferase (APT) family kinase protein
VAKTFYVQPNAPDPVLDFELVLTLARRHAPGAGSVTGVDETGGEARTYAIDDGLILKTQRPQQLRPRTSLEREAFFLNQLAGVPGVNVPRVLGYGRDGQHIEYTLMTRMPGIAARNAEMTGQARQDTLKDLGRMLRRIHQIPQEPFLKSRLFPGDHAPVDVRTRVANQLSDLLETIDREQCPWTLPLLPEAVGRCALAALPDVEDIVALHSNPGREHTFVDPATGKLNGLIDFGDSYFSHPASDLSRWRSPADRQAILTGYIAEQPVSENFMQAWRVVQVLIDMTVIAYYPDERASVEADLQQLLAEL